MKYNIIGDVHHHRGWTNVVDLEAVNVFTGDYLDSFAPFTFKQKKDNFDELIQFKKDHPETILLFGNHDFLQYYKGFAECSGFQKTHSKAYRNWITENKDMFQMAYAIDDKILVTHAGVTLEWYQKYFPDEKEEDYTPQKIADNINSIYENHPLAFSFELNSMYGDVYGTTPTQSCLWIRPSVLVEHNIFKDKDYLQVVGHTIVDEIYQWDKIILIDCLGKKLESYKYETAN